MKSNYNQLGQYIEMVSRTNSDLKYGIEDVRGCSNTKQMMQTRANLIGRTYEKFIVLRPQEFVFNRRTTRNGEKIGMAYNNTDREYIFTNDYVAFRVKQEYLDKLLPDYLYMFFCRDEFDRYARYKSTGSATEFFNWEDMCAVPFEIPPMDFQQLVVNAYKVLNERIETKQKINDNLANQISAIYDDYFVQYKCSTVTSYIDSPLGKIPSNYKVLTIGELGCDISDGNYSSKYPKADEFQTVGIPFIRGVDFIGTNISKRNLLYITPEKHNELLKGHTKENDILITTRGVGIGKIAFVPSDMIDVNINSQLIRINGGNTYPRVFLSQSLISNRGKNEIQANVTGSAQPQLPVGNFKNIKIVIPPESQILDFCRICNPLLNAQLENYQEIDVLQKLLDVLLTKLSSR